MLRLLSISFFTISLLVSSTSLAQNFYKEKLSRDNILIVGFGPSFAYIDNGGPYRTFEFEVKPWELTDLEIEANLNEKCLSGRIDTFEIDTTMYHQIDEFPRFPGCEYDHMDEQEKRKCSEIKLLNYLYVNLKYPQKARRKGIEGRVFIQFVIEHLFT